MPSKKPKAKTPPPAPAAIDQGAVARLAYELYLRRGGESGHDVEDWLMAERLLLEQSARAGGRRAKPKKARRFEDKFSG